MTERFCLPALALASKGKSLGKANSYDGSLWSGALALASNGKSPHPTLAAADRLMSTNAADGHACFGSAAGRIEGNKASVLREKAKSKRVAGKVSASKKGSKFAAGAALRSVADLCNSNCDINCWIFLGRPGLARSPQPRRPRRPAASRHWRPRPDALR